MLRAPAPPKALRRSFDRVINRVELIIHLRHREQRWLVMGSDGDATSKIPL